ncbi:MAG: hypothetical protein AB8F26_02510 [Phycisphaerales bacterium]
MHAPEIVASISGLKPDPAHPWGATTQDACRWIRKRTRCVALDAARSDLRARELGRSARRDVGAMLRRTELELAGIDLWIPAEHYTNNEKSQRAMDTLHETIVLATELARLAGGRSRPMVSVTLPTGLGDADRTAINHLGERHGALIADHTPDGPPSMGSNIAGLVVGVDPASCLMGGVNPEQRVHDAGALRLTDANPSGRCVVASESSRLDLTAYAGACLTSGQRWIITDAWGIENAERAIDTAVHAWREAIQLPL